MSSATDIYTPAITWSAKKTYRKLLKEHNWWCVGNYIPVLCGDWNLIICSGTKNFSNIWMQSGSDNIAKIIIQSRSKNLKPVSYQIPATITIFAMVVDFSCSLGECHRFTFWWHIHNPLQQTHPSQPLSSSILYEFSPTQKNIS